VKDILITKTILNIVLETDYCYHRKMGGKILFLSVIPIMDLGLISQCILERVFKIKGYFSTYSIPNLFYISIFSSFQANSMHLTSHSSKNLRNYALKGKLTTMVR